MIGPQRVQSKCSPLYTLINVSLNLAEFNQVCIVITLFSIDLAPNGNSFGAKLIGKVYYYFTNSVSFKKLLEINLSLTGILHQTGKVLNLVDLKYIYIYIYIYSVYVYTCRCIYIYIYPFLFAVSENFMIFRQAVLELCCFPVGP